MSLIDSVPTFASRCLGLRVTSLQIAALATAGYDTYGSFSFFVPFQNGSPDDTLLKTNLDSALGAPVDTVDMGKFRRLLFEAHALMMADTRGKIERTEDSAPRKLPAPERAHRLAIQAARLAPALIISDWNEPSHALLDAVQQQMDEAQLKYMPVEACTCRLQEIAGIKKVPTTMTDKNGFIRVEHVSEELTLVCGGDLFKVRQALLRRALAYDQAGIIRFEIMEQWHNHLLEALQRDPPPGHRRVGLEQMLLADREIFIRMIENCRAGLLPDVVTGVGPADSAMSRLQMDARITVFLLPLPGSSASSSRGEGLGSPGLPGQGTSRIALRRKRQREESVTARPSVQASKGGAKGRGDKGKGKGKKGKGKGSSMPAGLEGCINKINGTNICYGFNLGNCPHTVASGDACEKGLHKCCKPGCGGDHPFYSCPRP
jgi:hypothetical protein